MELREGEKGMKKTFPLGRMSVQEMDSLDVNKKQYKKVFEFKADYKKSFVQIEICQYKNEFFYGLNYRFVAPPFKNGGTFSALRKWGTYTSLIECKKAIIKAVKNLPITKREVAIVNKFNLQDIFNGD